MQAFQVRSFVSPFRNAILVLMLTLPAALTQAQSTVVYVDINNGALNPPDLGQNGWEEDAFRFLQDALAATEVLMDFPHNFESVDIWVAAGVYKPDHDSNNPTGSCSGSAPNIFCDPDATFTIPNNVRIFGGFIGDGTESTLDERNGGVHDPTLTILTGDLADGNASPASIEDAYSTNVVTFDDTDASARLDTVTVKGGLNAGALFEDSDAILSNCIFTENWTHAVLMNGTGTEITSEPRIINCQFIENDTNSRAAEARGVVRPAAR